MACTLLMHLWRAHLIKKKNSVCILILQWLVQHVNVMHYLIKQLQEKVEIIVLLHP